VIRVEHLRRSFDALVAVDDVSFEVRNGEVFGLLGPNGAGKTTVTAALGGCWWPLEVVSEPLQAVALALPTGWATTALHGTISFGRGLDGVIIPLAVLLGFGVLFSWIALRSLRID
jgi:hypothetical protein